MRMPVPSRFVSPGRPVAGAAAAAVLGAVLVGAVGAPALADPPAGTSPAPGDLVGVGSDTTQGVLNHIAGAYNAQPGVTAKLAGWDATGSSPIVPKQGCAPIERPNGSSAGIDALTSGAGGPGCVDFARSSRSKRSDGSENGLAFVALARDGVTWATPSRTNAPAGLTAAQLAAVYTCTATTWDRVGGSSTATIRPLLPQAGSGTRSFWLSALGITEAQVGGCVTQGVQENTGTALPADPDVIAPYSVAVYIAQAYRGIDDRHGTTVLGQVDAVAPVVAPGPDAALNDGMPARFLRTVFTVAPRTAAGEVPAALGAVFGAGGYVCTHQELVSDYGFGRLGAGCGAVS